MQPCEEVNQAKEMGREWHLCSVSELLKKGSGWQMLKPGDGFPSDVDLDHCVRTWADFGEQRAQFLTD